MDKTIISVQQLMSGFSQTDSLKIEKALAIVSQTDASPPSLRPRGIDVAMILMAVHIDVETILAALLSDSRIAGRISEPDIEKKFGSIVAALVKDVNWLNKLTVYNLEMANQPNQAEILRRMLLAMTHDVRAVLIKLAYRIQRLRNLHSEDYDMRRFIAQESLDIYAPLANRLGINQFKWELEDLAFRYLDPQNYRFIAKSLADNRNQREACIQSFKETLSQALENEHINAKVYGRPKHIYSIWNKMFRKNLAFEDLYDLLAVRVIVDNMATCYSVLGLVHSLWQYIPKEFDDYIANPKENGYQSLHTVILDTQGNRIEVQIRTRDMHEFAELGVAAHWRYKEGSQHNAATAKNIASLRKLLDERDNNAILIENFRTELFTDRVFVLTPAGKLVDLIKGATPLDFAYAIHTEIGHSCRGAKVDGQIRPLTYQLKSGQRVEIITVKNGYPNLNWIDPSLGYLKTSRAISKVKSWFKQQKQCENITIGKQLLDKEVKRLGVKALNLDELIKHFKMEDSNFFFESLGRGDISVQQIAHALQIPELEPAQLRYSPQKNLPRSQITVGGIDNIETSLAKCCSPVKGDNIIGFISHKRGITIHRRNCPNILALDPEKKLQLIAAEWNSGQQTRHIVPIVIHAYNSQTLLNDVSQILFQSKVHITDASLRTHTDLSAILYMSILIENTAQLSQVLSRISQLPTITAVKRKT
ncbi:bifunctional (p)ppGpp synthetase/guanosine-3',5'-bis(diphosphate) 3'-pyrophosphohydrolase [Methylicorpusculum oleiharenae]|uniref:RelA/SpoT family protein n=1 Tax=Methylicorpusculum oleiharenae TaxID=1338687 RepID=UPI001358AE49|nr:bifunctional (p)ppGpp synthetase/guanosine-3',5'-bis(diphosphate) 3'-pyrophosphohydrolase [Methylicorpusculum oleiharenae]MCD2449754.1 bifunctional (p)ppGpp synthetase/guanosine-3',5'-bis(diphosphate) 3'-pyrophosphohydrolase [Methylicorpusculum oleiharenae]